MTSKANYAQLIDQVFGAGAVTFDIQDPSDNNVIGALASTSDFFQFQAAFKARLERLNAALTCNANLRKPVLVAVNSIGDKNNWDGAFAELTALDYFVAGNDPCDIELDVTMPAAETLAKEMGKTNANVDLVLRNFGVSLDTKLLSDKTGDLLKGIFAEVLRKKGIARLPIIPTYAFDQAYEPFETQRKRLVAELEKLLDPVTRPPSAQSNIIPELSYEFAWDRGAYGYGTIYSPEEHAHNHHPLLFKHAKKFSVVRPSGIAFVHFPWSGEKLFPLGDANRRFFRQFGEEFFSGYAASPEPAKRFNRDFKSAMLADDVSRYLSFLIFLEDKSVTATDPSAINVVASYRVNPRAKMPVMGSLFEGYLKSRAAMDLALSV
jgi:hypothetical protein